MSSWLYVGLGGFAGAIVRWRLSSWFQRVGETIPLPIGVLAVNLLGSLAIGLFAGFSYAKGWLQTPVQLLVVTGFLGAFTTYSAFGLEGVQLLRDGKMGSAALYAALHLFLGWGLVILGWWIATPRGV